VVKVEGNIINPLSHFEGVGEGRLVVVGWGLEWLGVAGIGVWQGVAMDSLKFHLPHASTPCRWTTPETALQPFQGWPACSVAVFYLFGHPMPYVYGGRCVGVVGSVERRGRDVSKKGREGVGRGRAE
jgi:hypothetical protein